MCNRDLKLPIVQLTGAGETLNISQHVPGLNEPTELLYTWLSAFLGGDWLCYRLQMNIKVYHGLTIVTHSLCNMCVSEMDSVSTKNKVIYGLLY